MERRSGGEKSFQGSWFRLRKNISWLSSAGVGVLHTFSMIITRRLKKKKSNLKLIYRPISTQRQCQWHRCMIVTVVLSRWTRLAFQNQECPAEVPADLRFIRGSYLSDSVSLFIHYSASLQQQQWRQQHDILCDNALPPRGAGVRAWQIKNRSLEPSALSANLNQ